MVCGKWLQCRLFYAFHVPFKALSLHYYHRGNFNLQRSPVLFVTVDHIYPSLLDFTLQFISSFAIKELQPSLFLQVRTSVFFLAHPEMIRPTLPGCWNQWSTLGEPVNEWRVIGTPSGLHQDWVNRARSYMEQWSQALAPTHLHKRLREWLKKQNDTHIVINSNHVQKCKSAQSSLCALSALCHFGLVLQ